MRILGFIAGNLFFQLTDQTVVSEYGAVTNIVVRSDASWALLQLVLHHGQPSSMKYVGFSAPQSTGNEACSWYIFQSPSTQR